ncbi:hypothetical protein BT69DRAFT_1281830 [Atractiella rhizophila]|nr:hypothetical protein BT69DRAFT_1281830 [Atractiella rhizophila]
MSKVVYEVKVSAPDGFVPFIYEEEPLKAPTPTTALTPEMQGAYLARLVSLHQKEIFDSRKWECAECSQPAQRMIHNPMSYLYLAQPRVLDLAFPLCQTGGTCDQAIRRGHMDIMRELKVNKAEFKSSPGSGASLNVGPVPENPSPASQDTDGTNNCRVCSELSTMRCGKCKVAPYCSKEHQREDWPQHRKECGSNE